MTATTSQLKSALLLLCFVAFASVRAGVVSEPSAGQQATNQFDAPSLRVISDEDRALMQSVKGAIEDDFANLRDINEVNKLLSNVKLLVHKHPKNSAFAQGDLKELHKFLSREMVTRLIRVDSEPFDNLMGEESKLEVAQRAVASDELTGKLFGAPLRSLIEAKKQENRQQPEGNSHRDGNFFQNFWCKISGNCSS